MNTPPLSPTAKRATSARPPRRRALLAPFALLTLLAPLAALTSSATEGSEQPPLFARTTAALNPAWSGFLSCSLHPHERDPYQAAADAIPFASAPIARHDITTTAADTINRVHSNPTKTPAIRPDYNDCAAQTLRTTSARLLLSTMEDALRQTGLAAFDQGFALDSRLTWIWDEDIQGEIDATIPLWNNADSAIFVQPGFAFWSGLEEVDRADANLGLVYRRDFGDDTIFGTSLFYDYDLQRGHRRLGLGTDLQSGSLHGGINYYHPLTEWREGRTPRFEEQALQGTDLRFGAIGKRFRFDATLGLWHFEGERDESSRWEASYATNLGLRLYPGVFLEGGYERHDADSLADRWHTGLAFRFALPGLEGASGRGGGAPVPNLWKPVQREKRILYEERIAIDPHIATFSLDPATITEGASANIVITLDRPLPAPATLTLSPAESDDYTLSPSAATADTLLPDALVTIPMGETAITAATIHATPDSEEDSAEVFEITAAIATAPEGVDGLELHGLPLRLTINDNTVGFAAAGNPASIAEGATTGNTFTVTTANTVTTAFELAVTAYETDDSGACTTTAITSGITPNPATLNFTTSAASATFAVTIADDMTPEGAESICLRLASENLPAGWVITPATATFTIPGNQNTITFAPPDPATPGGTPPTIAESIDEDGGSTAFTISTQSPPTQDITFTIALDAATATADRSEYTLTNSSGSPVTSVTIPQGATKSAPITITSVDDTAPEGPETIILTLGGSPLDGWDPSEAELTVTIIDDDMAVVSFTTAPDSVDEGTSGSFTVSTTAGIPVRTPFDITVAAYTVTGTNNDACTSTAATGITPSSSTLSFSSTATAVTFTVPIPADDTPEGAEYFCLELTSAAALPSPWNFPDETNNREQHIFTVPANDKTVRLGETEAGVTIEIEEGSAILPAQISVVPSTESETITLTGTITPVGSSTGSVATDFNFTGNDDLTITAGPGSAATFSVNINTSTLPSNNLFDIIFPIADDSELESIEEFAIELTAITDSNSNNLIETGGWAILANDPAYTLRVLDNDISIAFSAASDGTALPATQAEPDSGGGETQATTTVTVGITATVGQVSALDLTAGTISSGPSFVADPTVTIAAATGSTADMNDFTIDTSSVSFSTTDFTSAVTATKDITLTISGDSITEAAETIILELTNATTSTAVGVQRGTNHTITIPTNDNTISLALADASIDETGTESTTLTVTLSNPAPAAITVNLEISNYDADAFTLAAVSPATWTPGTVIPPAGEAGSDTLPGDFTIPANTVSGALTITAAADTDSDSEAPTFAINSTTPTDGTLPSGWTDSSLGATGVLGTTTSRMLTVVDADSPTVGFAATGNPTSLAEGATTGNTFTVSTATTVPSAFQLTVNVRDADCTTANTTDATVTGSPVDITDAAKSDTFTVTVTDDTDAEGEETICLVLTGTQPSGWTIEPATASFTIPASDNTIGFTSALTDLSVGLTEDDDTTRNIPLTINGTVPAGGLPLFVSVNDVDDCTAVTSDSRADLQINAAAPPTTVTIPAGAVTGGSTAVIPYTILEDNLPESQDCPVLTITNPTSPPQLPTGWSIPTANAAHTLNIPANEQRIRWNNAVTTASVAEDVSGGSIDLTLQMQPARSAATTVTVTVPSASTGEVHLGSSAATTDITIAANATTATVPVTIVNDTATNGDRTYAVTITAINDENSMDISSTYTITDAVLTLTVTDDESIDIGITDAPTSITEGETDSTNNTFTVTVGGAIPAGNAFSLDVDAFEHDGTSCTTTEITSSAADGITITPATLSFPVTTDATSSETFTVTPNDDSTAEAEETVCITISGTLPTGFSFSTSRATVEFTIPANDNTISLARTGSGNLAEGSGTDTLTVTLSTPAPTGGISMTLTITDTAATTYNQAALGIELATGQTGRAWGNFAVANNTRSGMLVIPAGETTAVLDITANADNANAVNENLEFTLSEAASPNQLPEGWGLSTGVFPATPLHITIEDDEETVGFTATHDQITEGTTSGNFTVTATAAPATAFAIAVAANTHDGTSCTATAATGITITSSPLNFTTSTTSHNFTVAVTNDDDVEEDETICLALSSSNLPSNFILTPSTHTFTIPANDNNRIHFTSTGSTVANEGGFGILPLTVLEGTIPTAGLRITFTANPTGEVTTTPIIVRPTDSPLDLDIPVIDDTHTEPQDDILITLTAITDLTTPGPETWSVGANNTHTIAIQASDPALGFSSLSRTVAEGDIVTIAIRPSGAATPRAISTTLTFSSVADLSLSSATQTFSIPNNTADGTGANFTAFTVTDDTTQEDEETVTITLTSSNLPAGWQIDPDRDTFTLTIRASDQPNQPVGFTTASLADLDEGSTSPTITVTADTTAQTVDADFQLNVAAFQHDGTSCTTTSSTDVTFGGNAADGNLDFTSTANSDTFTITAAADTDAEIAETVCITLSEGTGFNSGSNQWRVDPATLEVTIPANGNTVGFASVSDTVTEDSGTYAISLGILSTPVNAADTEISLSIALASASTGSTADLTTPDFTSAQNATIAANATTGTLSLTINDDSSAESDETLIFDIVAADSTFPPGWTLDAARAQFTLTIEDNDQPTLGFAATGNPTTIAEGATTGNTFTVTASGAITTAFNLMVTAYAADCTTAVSDVTITPSGGTGSTSAVTLAFAQTTDTSTDVTFTVTPADDTDYDPEETICLVLTEDSTAAPATADFADGIATGRDRATFTIPENDAGQAVSLFFHTSGRLRPGGGDFISSFTTSEGHRPNPDVAGGGPGQQTIDHTCLEARLPEGVVAPAGGLPLVVSATRPDGSNPAMDTNPGTGPANDNRDISFNQLSSSSGGTINDFDEGDNSENFCLNLLNDAETEPAETITISLSEGTNFPSGFSIASGTVTLTIAANDPDHIIRFADDNTMDAGGVMRNISSGVAATDDETPGRTDLLLQLFDGSNNPAVSEVPLTISLRTLSALKTAPDRAVSQATITIPPGVSEWLVPVWWFGGSGANIATIDLPENDAGELQPLPWPWKLSAAGVGRSHTVNINDGVGTGGDPDERNTIAFAATTATLYEDGWYDLKILLRDASADANPVPAPAGGITLDLSETYQGDAAVTDANITPSEYITLNDPFAPGQQPDMAENCGLNPRQQFSRNGAFLNIPAGVTEFTVPIAALRDCTAEDAETFQYEITANAGTPLPAGWTLGTDTTITLTIPANEQHLAQPPTIGFTSDRLGSIGEGTAISALIGISPVTDVPTGGITLNITVDKPEDVRIQDANSASANVITSVTFPAGTPSNQSAFFWAIEDSLQENSKEVIATLSLPEGASLPEGWRFGSRTIIIPLAAGGGGSDGREVGFVDAGATGYNPITSLTATEGETITVRVAAAATPAGTDGFKLDVAATENDDNNTADITLGGTALVSNRLTFTAVESFQEFTITIVDDDDDESAEDITLALAAVTDDADSTNGGETLPTNWVIRPATLTLTIPGHLDSTVHFANDYISAAEGETIDLTVVFPHPIPDDGTTYTLQLTDHNTSNSGNDLTLPTAAVDLAAGATSHTFADIPIVADATAEFQENITLTIDNSGTSLPTGWGYTEKMVADPSDPSDPPGMISVTTARAIVVIPASDSAIAFATAATEVTQSTLEALAAGTAHTETLTINLNAADSNLPAAPSGGISLIATSSSPAITLDSADDTPQQTTISLDSGDRTATLTATIDPTAITEFNQRATITLAPDPTTAALPLGWSITQPVHNFTLNTPDVETIGFASAYNGYLRVAESDGSNIRTIDLELSAAIPAGETANLTITSSNPDLLSIPDDAISLAAAATSATPIPITIHENLDSGDATVLLTLTATDLPTDWQLAPDTLLIHIADNDNIIFIPRSNNSLTVAEGDTGTNTSVSVAVRTPSAQPVDLDVLARFSGDIDKTNIASFATADPDNPGTYTTRATIINSQTETTINFMVVGNNDAEADGIQRVTITLEPHPTRPLPAITRRGPCSFDSDETCTIADGNRPWHIAADRNTFTLTITDDDGETIGFNAGASTRTTFEGATNANLTLNLSAAAPAARTFGEYRPFCATGDATCGALTLYVTSSSPSDAFAQGGFIVVPQDARSVTIPLVIPRDDSAETEDETVTFTLSRAIRTYQPEGGQVTDLWPEGWRINNNTHTLTIRADDAPLIHFANPVSGRNERDGTINLRVNFTQPAPAGGFSLTARALQLDTGTVNDSRLLSFTGVPNPASNLADYTGARCPDEGGEGNTCATTDISFDPADATLANPVAADVTSTTTIMVDAGATHADIPVTIVNDTFLEGHQVMKIHVSASDATASPFTSSTGNWSFDGDDGAGTPATTHTLTIFPSDDRFLICPDGRLYDPAIHPSDATTDTESPYYSCATAMPPPPPPSEIRFASSSATTLNENGGTATITIETPDPAPSGGISLTVTPTGTATNNTDYRLSTTTLGIPANSTTSNTLTITGIDDSAGEGPETIILTLTGTPPTGWIIDTDNNTHTITINDDDQGVGFSTATHSESLAENAAAVTIPVTLAPTLSSSVTLDVSVANSDTPSTAIANDNDDFTVPATITFAANAGSQNLSLTIKDDTTAEADETFTITLAPDTASATALAAYSGQRTYDFTIAASDNTISFTSASATSVAENAGTATVSVETDTAPTEAITLTVTPTGTAANTTDYTLSSTTFTISAGSTTGNSITITGIDDSTTEGAETIILTITASATLPTGWSIAAAPDNAHTVTINDDDQGVGFATATHSESLAEDAAAVTIPVTLAPTLSSSVTLDVSVANSDTPSTALAHDNDDFTVPATLTFAANEGSQNLSLTIKDDTTAEADETFTITLAPDTASATALAAYSGQRTYDFTIAASDNTISFASSSATSVDENGGTATVTVETENAPSQPITLTVTVDDTSTATQSSSGDYTLSSTTFTIQAGSTTSNAITITGVNDEEIDLSETIILTITAQGTLPAGWSIDTDNDEHTITIRDDDAPSVSLTTAPTTGNEGDTLRFTLTASETHDAPIAVVITLMAGASCDMAIGREGIIFDVVFSDAGTDTAGHAIIAANETSTQFSVRIIDGNIAEPEETFCLVFTKATVDDSLPGSAVFPDDWDLLTTQHTFTVPENDQP